jgi:hypothetical protein
MSLNDLPKEILSKILLYLECPVAKLIKNEINYYNEDHNWEYTKMFKRYYVKNFMDFSVYYFDRLNEPESFKSYYDRMNDEIMIYEDNN